MMISRAKTIAFTMLPAVAAFLVLQACGGGEDARAQTTTTPDPLEGFWQSSISLKDCSSGAPLGGFRGLTLFNQGGTASADNNQPSATKGTAMGTWTKSATGTYVVNLRFWRYLPDGSPAGQQRLTRTITLAADGNSLTSTITTQALDASDNVMQSACGTETGTRIN
ncbi:MAG: hypothetical protein M3Y55_10770 [Pseudomonadota bacterium]|nr:hypothetical protein [Pseudomonadota bacterium]